jgi:hypothetical protein
VDTVPSTRIIRLSAREVAVVCHQGPAPSFDVVRKRIEENVEGIRNFGKKLATELHPRQVPGSVGRNYSCLPEKSLAARVRVDGIGAPSSAEAG